MEVFRNGKFSWNVFNIELSTGLKKEDNKKRNDSSMEELTSMVGQREVLQSVPELTAFDTSFVFTSFPFPQLFELTNYVILCTEDKIYEYNAPTWILKKSLSIPGTSTWRVIDFYNYVYLSNGTVSLVRDSLTQNYTISDLPITEAMCNFNGQVFISGDQI